MHYDLVMDNELWTVIDDREKSDKSEGDAECKLQFIKSWVDKHFLYQLKKTQ